MQEPRYVAAGGATDLVIRTELDGSMPAPKRLGSNRDQIPRGDQHPDAENRVPDKVGVKQQGRGLQHLDYDKRYTFVTLLPSFCFSISPLGRGSRLQVDLGGHSEPESRQPAPCSDHLNPAIFWYRGFLILGA